MLQWKTASLAEMPFRQALLSDPATMAYNAPWAPPTGCLDFPATKWAPWLERWTNQAPERFCAYLVFPGKASRLVKSAGTTTARKSARSSMRPTVARDMAWRGFGYWRRWPSVTRKYPVCATILRPAASLPCASIKRPGLKLPEKRTDCSLCVCPVNNGCAGLVLHEHSGTSNMQFICFPLVSIWADRRAVIHQD